MNSQSWEQKLQAVQAIGDVSLSMRKPGDWYVSVDVERVENGLRSVRGMSAPTPEAAVEQFWAWLTDSRYHIRRSDGTRVRWNGFMWDRVEVAAGPQKESECQRMR